MTPAFSSGIPHCRPARALRVVLAKVLAVAALLSLAGVIEPAAAQQGAPDGVVRALYQHYLDAKPDEDFEFDYGAPKVAPRYFDPELARLLIADGKRDTPRVDFDPFVEGQDFDITHIRYETNRLSAGEAEVAVNLVTMGDAKSLDFRVVRTPAGWRISDVTWEGQALSLRDLLTSPGR